LFKVFYEKLSNENNSNRDDLSLGTYVN